MGELYFQNKRDVLFDNIKGILIILVVLGHLIAGKKGSDIDIYSISHYLIYAVHMPMFIMLSGIFSNRKYDLKRFIRDSLVPYITFELLYILFNVIGDGEYNLNILIARDGYWYILCVGIMRFLFAYIKHPRILIIISVLCSIPLIFVTNDTWRILSIGRVFLLLPIFIGGTFFPVKSVQWIKKNQIIFIVFAVIIIWAELLLFEKGIVLTGTHNQPSSIVDLGLKYVFMMVFTTGLFLTLIAIMPNRELFLITKCGRNSIMVYLFHFFIVKIIVYAISYMRLTWDNYLFVLLLLLSLLVSWLLSSEKLHKAYLVYIKKVSSILKLN